MPEKRHSLRVVCYCTYRTRRTINWTDRDFAAHKLIKAIKGEPLIGWADIPIHPGHPLRLDASNTSDASDVFGRVAAAYGFLRNCNAVSLVPIPDSQCTAAVAKVPKTKALVDALVKHAPEADVTVADVLRWSEPTGQSHSFMGRRYPEQLYPLLRLRDSPPAGRSIILVDDPLTTGGHLRATAAFLRANGAAVDSALCAGRSDQRIAAVPDAFALRVEYLEPFVFDPCVFDVFPDAV